MPQPREDPALGDLHRDFDFGVVALLGRSRRQNGRRVVSRPLFVRPLEDRLVTAGVASGCAWRYSRCRSSSVTPVRRSSVWIQAGSGSGRVTRPTIFGPYSRCSRASSVRPSSVSHASPIPRARLMTDATAPALIPRLRAASRWLRCKCHFRRKISRMCRMGRRSVAITLSAEPCRKRGDGKTTPCIAPGALSRRTPE